jgi:hypothetical protein
LVITALVGLDAIERGQVTEVPEELHTVWSPKDAVASARRSRRLILDMALVRAVDAIDIYIRESVRKPRLVQNPVLRVEIDRAGLSIFKKLLVIDQHFHALDAVPVALVGLMVAWRNKGAHAEADDQPVDRYRQIIEVQADQIASRFRGLQCGLLLSGYDEERPPTFKEVASFINAAHHYVSDLDHAQLRGLDQELFLTELVWKAISTAPREKETLEQTRKRHLRSIWGKDPSERAGYVQRFLRQQGIAFGDSNSLEAVALTLKENLVSKLGAMSPSDVWTWMDLEINGDP